MISIGFDRGRFVISLKRDITASHPDSYTVGAKTQCLLGRNRLPPRFIHGGRQTKLLSAKIVGERSISKNLPTITQDLSRRYIPTRGESVSTYPCRLKAEVFSNAVDVVERLHDPTDPSTERMTPPCSSHVQHDDVPRALDPADARGRVSSARRCGDGVDDVICAGLRLSTTMI